MGCPRVSYRRRMHYATRGNRMKLVRTPGNRLVMQKRQKRSQGIHTPWVLGHQRLAGTKALRHIDARKAPKTAKTVNRAYGGVLSHKQVRDRIIRAFLMEEQRIIAKVAEKAQKVKKVKDRRLSRIKRKMEVKRVAEHKAQAKKDRLEAAKKRGPTVSKNVPLGGKVLKKKVH